MLNSKSMRIGNLLFGSFLTDCFARVNHAELSTISCDFGRKYNNVGCVSNADSWHSSMICAAGARRVRLLQIMLILKLYSYSIGMIFGSS